MKPTRAITKHTTTRNERNEGVLAMRKVLVGLAMLALMGAACAPEDDTADGASGTSRAPPPATAKECAQSPDALRHRRNALTIATGNPAYAPWFGGASVPDSEWKSSQYTGDPHTGEGYERAFAYALADRWASPTTQVEWVGIPFTKSFAPGPKDFDFAMQQISYSDKRAEAVDFSDGYFDVNQALIAERGFTGDRRHHARRAQGPQAGGADRHDQPPSDRRVGAAERRNPACTTTSTSPSRTSTTARSTGWSWTTRPRSTAYADVVVGQFPPVGGEQEYFGVTFEQGQPAGATASTWGSRSCKQDGTLQKLQDKWLTTDVDVPLFS